MKKFILTSFILFTLTLSSIIGVRAAPVYDDFDFTVYDNEKYDLLTGFKSIDENYSITNKIFLDKDLIGNEVIFSHDDFHHVLFFNEYNAYIGYVNTDKSDLQLDTWINNDVAIDGTLIIPDGVDKIALMNYNFGAFRDDIIYTNEDIDNIAWGTLTYRDIFQGTNLILNSTFDTATSWFGECGVFSSVDGVGFLDGWACAPTWQTFYQGPNTGMITNGNEYYISVDTLYPIYYDSFHISINQDIYWPTLLDYTDDITEMTNFADIFIAPDDSTYIYFIYDKGIAIVDGDDLYIDNVYLYDLTTIFTTNLPTVIEFETMQLYYDTYKDAVDEISYNDIFTNNLLINGDFADGFNGWTVGVNITDEWIADDTVYWTGVGGLGGANDLTQNITITGGIYYYNFRAKGDNTLRVYNPQFGDTVLALDGIMTSYSNLKTVNATGSSLLYLHVPLSNYVYVVHIIIYPLTEIFGYVEDDITTTWIEARYDEWLDPLGEGTYTAYYPAANLITVDIDYSWDDTPAADPDAITSIDESLVKMGVITDELKVFFAFVIMILAAIFIGLATHNSTFIILAEAVLIIIFTMMGWFSFWILLLMALVFTLLILRNGLKGGNNK